MAQAEDAGWQARADQMVREQIESRGVRDPRVLAAMRAVPRHRFVPESHRASAWDDGPLPIGHRQTISQPYIVAVMTEAARVEPGDRVLEVGTGSGYQAAVLAMMGAKVFTIERHAELLRQARESLARVGCNVATHLGDGTLGWMTYAPYDRIIVTAGAPEVPMSLLRQLAPDGRLLIPTGGRDAQRMQMAIKVGDASQYDLYDYGEFKFVPLIGRNAWEREGLGS
jgi:protein-L-isoaspartate(D-aspartate) O-methyltransferase